MLDKKKMENDTKRTEAIVSLVESFRSAAEREQASRLVTLAGDFVRTASALLNKDDMTTEEAVDVINELQRA